MRKVQAEIEAALGFSREPPPEAAAPPDDPGSASGLTPNVTHLSVEEAGKHL